MSLKQQPTLEFDEKLKDRTSFLEDLFTMTEDHPVICVDGDTRDLVLRDGEWMDPVDGICRHMMDEGGFDVVMAYDAVLNTVVLADEMPGSEKNKGKNKVKKRGETMRTKLDKMDLQVYGDHDPETNMVTGFLAGDSKKIRRSDSAMSDQILFSIVDQINEGGKGGKICVVVDQAQLFVPVQVAGMTNSDKARNAALLEKMYLSQQSNDDRRIQWVLVDRKGEADSGLKKVIGQMNIAGTSRRDIKTVLNGVTEVDPSLLELARGIGVRELIKLKKKAGEDDGKALAAELKNVLPRIKEDYITKLTGGLVTCITHPLTRDQVWIPDEEWREWEGVKMLLQKGSDSIPAGLTLTGPPGTGKSARAQMLASELGIPFLEARDFGEEGLAGVKLKKLQTVFEAAILVKPCVLFIDEASESMPNISGNSNGGKDNDDAAFLAYLKRMEGSPEMKGVVIIRAVNNPKRMNAATMRAGRGGGRTIAVLPPETPEEKAAIFRAVWKQRKALREQGEPSELLVSLIANESPHGATGADFLEIFDRAALEYEAGNKGIEEAITEAFSQYSFPMVNNPDFWQMVEQAKRAATVSFNKKDEMDLDTVSFPESEEVRGAKTEDATKRIPRPSTLKYMKTLLAAEQRLKQEKEAVDRQAEDINEKEKELRVMADDIAKLTQEVNEAAKAREEEHARARREIEDLMKAAQDALKAAQDVKKAGKETNIKTSDKKRLPIVTSPLFAVNTLECKGPIGSEKRGVVVLTFRDASTKVICPKIINNDTCINNEYNKRSCSMKVDPLPDLTSMEEVLP